MPAMHAERRTLFDIDDDDTMQGSLHSDLRDPIYC